MGNGKIAKKKNQKLHEEENSPLLWVMLLLVPFFGGYYLNTMFFLGFILIICLSFHIFYHQNIILPSNLVMCSFFFILLGYLVALPLTVSFGIAFTGVLKILVWILFLFFCLTYEKEEKQQILTWISYEGAIFSLGTIIAYFIDIFEGKENLNGRIDGLFQYANTWALYLLFCLIWILHSHSGEKKRNKLNICCLISLFVGLLLTGSRSGLILFIGVIFHYGYVNRKKVFFKKYILIGLSFFGVTLIILNIITDNLIVFRISQLFTSSSSVNGRLLYWLDGISMLKDYPLGIGKEGYFYLQPLYQRGIYTVKYIHNEYLQFFLEGGVLAGIGFLLLPFALFTQKNLEMREKVIILVFSTHFFVDFDTQFFVMIALLLLVVEKEKTVSFIPNKTLIFMPTILFLGIFLYFSFVYHLDFMGNSKKAYELFPYDLSLAEKKLENAETIEEKEKIAQRIQEKTDFSMLSLDFNVKYGEDSQKLEAKYQYLKLNRYTEETYLEMIDLLTKSFSEIPEINLEYALKVSELLEHTIENTHPLAYEIYDKADFSWADDIFDKLENLSKIGEVYD